jgi:hypothetical protein
MPSSRQLAQRYAAASRKKKRVTPRRVSAPAPGESPAEAAAVEAAEERTVITPAPPEPRVSAATVRSQRARPVVRRTFADYREEYRYVARDLRRVALVAGGLLVVLLVLHFALGIG